MKILKVIFIFVMMIATCGMITVANEYSNTEILQVLKTSIQKEISFYQKMTTCTPYEFYQEYGNKYKAIFKIHGKSNNTCHTQFGTEHCYYPLEVSKKVAEDSIRNRNEQLNNIITNNSYYSSTSDSKNAYINQMHNKYCNSGIEFH